MKKRTHNFNFLVNQNKLEIKMDPKELDRIERKIDDYHTKPHKNVIRKHGRYKRLTRREGLASL